MTVAGLLAEIAGIGRDGGSGGYRRFAFTREDAALGEWFTAAATARGAEVVTDRVGNQWAWWGDPDAALARGESPVVTGSHLDSVPDGGPLDGPLGVAAALAAVEALEPAAITRPLAVVRFVDEEGTRFGLACSGSRLLTGAASPDAVLGLRDAAGTTYAEAVAAAGRDPAAIGRDDEALRRIGVLVELHVEQGRALATPDLDAPVGVASRIRPHGRWRFDLAGRADHAGTTLLQDRDDPMLALADLVRRARDGAARHGVLATVGRVEVHPNAVNAVPSLVRAWLDARGDDEAAVRALVAELAAAVRRPGGGGPVEESWTATAEFDPDLAGRLAAVAGTALGRGRVPVLATGAGHDAGILSQSGVECAMLFVRNPTGISHSPAESADEADCEAGAEALRGVLVHLMSRGPGAVPHGAAPDDDVREARCPRRGGAPTRGCPKG